MVANTEVIYLNVCPLLAAAGGNRAGAGAWLKAKLLRRLTSQDMGEEKENNAPKRNLDEESAAVVIQSRKLR